MSSKNLGSVASGLQVTFLTNCAKEGMLRLFVIGDSHAGAYMRALLRIASSGGFEPYLMTLGGCRMINVTAPPPVAGCPDFIKASLAKLTTLVRKGDVIFLPGLHTPRYPSAESVATGPVSDILDATTIEASRKQLRALTALGAVVIVEGPKPVMPVAQYRCADWFNRDNPDCHVPSDITPGTTWHRMETPLHGLKRVVEALPNVRLWEPAQFLCKNQACAGYQDSRPLFYDHDHLSGYGNDVLLPPLLAEIRAASIGAGAQKRSVIQQNMSHR